MEMTLNLIASLGALFMAYHAWNGLRSYERKCWNWLITAQLLVIAVNFAAKAFA